MAPSMQPPATPSTPKPTLCWYAESTRNQRGAGSLLPEIQLRCKSARSPRRETLSSRLQCSSRDHRPVLHTGALRDVPAELGPTEGGPRLTEAVRDAQVTSRAATTGSTRYPTQLPCGGGTRRLFRGR
eukprot:1766709-Rhodomonas_salina.1